MEEYEPNYTTNFLSLVRYAPPVLVEEPAENTDQPPEGNQCKEMQRPRVASGTIDKKTEALLHTILPPRCWEENGQKWQQFVSTKQVTRDEVSFLQNLMDTRLEQCQARKTGVCPFRRQIHRQCFDEMIRQVTINCAERGMLLLRLRDEIHMTIEAYDCMYRGTLAFGLRKARQAEDEMVVLKERSEVLKIKHNALLQTISDLQLNLDKSEERDADVRAGEMQRHEAAVTFLEMTISQLQRQLDQIEERRLS